jgi:hypothetical protein
VLEVDRFRAADHTHLPIRGRPSMLRVRVNHVEF